MNSLVSIIIPTFNRAHLIGETLDSVLAQTYQNWECIIVDDGSKDNTPEVVNRYQSIDSRIKFLKRPDYKPKGANTCRNFGVDSSKGEYLIFLDSDDLLNEDCLRNRIKVFKINPELQFAVFSMGVLKDGKKNDSTLNSLGSCRETLMRLFLKADPMPWNITSPIWKKDFFIKQGGFNEKLKLFDDDEFHIRVIYNNDIKYIFFDITDCYYRFYEENMKKYQDDRFLGNLVLSHQELLRILNNLLSSSDKLKYKTELQYSLIMKLNAFFIENASNRNKFKKNVFYFFNNFESNFNFKFLFIIKYLALVYGYKRKGGFRLNKFLDSKINDYLKLHI